MAIADDSTTKGAAGRFCPHCASPTEGARFCPGCGASLEAITAVIEAIGSSPAAERPAGTAPPAPPPQGPSSTPPDRGRSRPILIGAGAALGLAAIAVAVVVLLGGRSTTDTARASAAPAGQAYAAKLHSALAPLASADARLSDALGALDGTGSSHSVAVRRADAAQSALTATRGAVRVLTVPASQAGLAQRVQQALNADNGYLQAVGATLSDPSNQSAEQLQTLATTASNAFVPLASVSPQAATSTSNTSSLTHWVSVQRRHVQATATATTTATETQTAAAAAAAPSTPPPSSGTDCGDNLMAGPNTSCPFAVAVRSAYDEAPGEVATVQAYSPVTDRTYSMSCAPTDDGVTCSGANNASVSFP